MEVRDEVEVHRGGRRRPFQYSLRSMFVVTTAAAIGLSLLVAGPYWLIMLVLVIVALAIPMLLTIALIYGRGAIRTFSIGALFPAGSSVSGCTLTRSASEDVAQRRLSCLAGASG